MSKHDEIRDHYEWRIDPSRASHDVLDWASARTQHQRFEVFLRHVDLYNRTLLDVGCGLGDLWAFLSDNGVPVRYTGVDISEKMLAAARQRQPGGYFLWMDVFAHECPFDARSFDVVFASGIFNLNLGNNRQFLPAALERLMLLADECAAFNLLHRRGESEAHRYAYYDPDEVLASIRRPGWNFEIIDDYLPNDFTVICRRET
jgi:SAM-dependent methyltransferase